MELFRLLGTVAINNTEANNALNETTGIAKSSESKMTTAFKAIGTAVVAYFSAKTIVDFGKQIVNVTASFEDAMLKVQSLSGATSEEYDKLTKAAIEYGSTTAWTSKDVADAMGYMALAGFGTNEILASTSGMLSLASASGEQLGTVTDILTDAMTGFGDSAADAGRYADVLATVQAKTNTTVGMLGEAFKYVSPLAGSYGYQLEDVSTALGMMANAGVKGSMSGTALSSIITRLGTNTDGCREAIEEMGIAFYNQDGSARNLSDVMVDLCDATKDMNVEQKSALAKNIAGQEAQKGLLAILNQGSDAYKELNQQIRTVGESTESEAQNMASNMESGIGGAIRSLQSAMEGFKISVGQRIIGPLGEQIREKAAWISGTLTPAVTGFMDKMINSGAWSKLMNFIKKTKSQISELPAKVLPKVIQKAQEIASAVIPKVQSVIESIKGFIENIIPIVQQVMDKLKPLWEKGFDFVSNLFSNKINNIMGIIQRILPIVQDVIEKLTPPLMLFIDNVLPALQNAAMGLMSSLMDVGMSVLNAIIDAVVQMIPILIQIINDVLPVIVTLIGSVMGIVSQLVPFLLEIIQTVLPMIISLLPTIMQLIQGIIPVIMQIIQAVLPVLIQLIQSLMPMIMQIIQAVLPVLIQLIQAVIPVVMQIIEAVLPVLMNLINTLLPIIMTIIETVLPIIISLIEMLLPPLLEIIQAILPVFVTLIEAILPLVTMVLEILHPIFDAIMQLIEPLVEILKMILPPLIEIIKGLVDIWVALVIPYIKFIAEILSTVLKTAIDLIMAIIETMKQVFTNVFGAIKEVVSTVVDFISENIVSKFGVAKDKAVEIFTSMKNTISDIFNGLWNIVKKVINGILGAIEGMGNGVINGINAIIKAMNNLSFDIPDWIPGMGGKKFGFNLSELSQISIPRLAKGGVVDEPTIAEIGEDGKEAVVPLENNTEWMKKLAGMGGQDNSLILELLRRIIDLLEGIDADNESLPEVLVAAIANLRFELNNREFARLVKEV